jgi:hypothetical protein
MKRLSIAVLIAVLPGCATTITESGRKVKVVPVKNEQFKTCQRLGQVIGEAGSFLNNGEYGVIYATNDARNKAGLIPGADTVEILSDGPRAIGGTVTGIVYNCNAPVTPTPVVTAHKPIVVPVVSVPGAVFDKARKCQEKGGVWVNDVCVLKIE